jgi:hypothetical protein
VRELFEDERASSLGDHEAASLAIERSGRRRWSVIVLGEGLQEYEARESQVRERCLAPASQRCIQTPRLDEPVGLTDRLAAGGARRGDADAGPATIEHPRDQRRSDVDPSAYRCEHVVAALAELGRVPPTIAGRRPKDPDEIVEAGGLSVMAEDDTDPIAIAYLVELRLLGRLHARGPHESDRPGGHALERRRRFRARPHDPLVRNLAADSNGKTAGVEATDVINSRDAPAGPLERFGHVPSQGGDHPHAGDDNAPPIPCLA